MASSAGRQGVEQGFTAEAVLNRRAYAVELRHDRRKLVIGVVDAERLAAADRTVLRQFRHDAVECLEAAAGDTEWRCRLPSFAVEADDSFHETRATHRLIAHFSYNIFQSCYLMSLKNTHTPGSSGRNEREE